VDAYLLEELYFSCALLWRGADLVGSQHCLNDTSDIHRE
jgi:hypothetical protein